MTLDEARNMPRLPSLERPLAACPECGHAVLRTRTTQQRVCSRSGCSWWVAVETMAARVRAALRGDRKGS